MWHKGRLYYGVQTPGCQRRFQKHTQHPGRSRDKLPPVRLRLCPGPRALTWRGDCKRRVCTISRGIREEIVKSLQDALAKTILPPEYAYLSQPLTFFERAGKKIFEWYCWVVFTLYCPLKGSPEQCINTPVSMWLL